MRPELVGDSVLRKSWRILVCGVAVPGLERQKGDEVNCGGALPAKCQCPSCHTGVHSTKRRQRAADSHDTGTRCMGHPAIPVCRVHRLYAS